MSSSTLSSEQILTLERIRETIIPTLLHQLSKAKTSLPDELNDREDMATQIEKLRKDLIYISHTFTGFKNFEKSVSALADILQQPQHNLELFFKTPVQTQFLDSQAKQFRSKLRLLTQIITNLKILIPSPHKLLLKVASSSALTSFQFDADQLLDQLRDLHLSKEFEGSPAVKDFRVLYNSLGDTTKLCLLCFAAFSANEVVKKGPLVHWWVGEGFVNPPVDGEKTVEEVADGIFEELTKKGCIETVKKKRRPVVRSFKMHPLIRSAVIVIAKEVKFLDFDVKGNPTVKFSKSYRACLMDGSSHLILVNKPNLDPDKKPLEPEKQKPLDPEKLQTIFNVNESYLDLSKVDWPKLRYVKVLHLGRWHRRVKHHIEVVDSESLTGLKYMRHLRLFSLRGVSRIMELPDSVCKLASLLILDLRACHNLEVLPKKIGWLKKLTHLDMSECYLLDRMPKGIALLSELQVLKGFIIGDHKTGSSCTLQELSGLQKLRKLTINTSREDFPRKEELIVLQQFGMLRKLIIAWGGLVKRMQHESVAATASTVNNNGGNRKQDSTAAPEPPTTCGIKTHNGKKTSKSVTFKQVIRSPTMNHETVNHEHFKELEKLDLQCYPQMTAPSWLMPGVLKSLKKLYIRGGRLQNLDHVLENGKWSTVEILRLKFLSELKLDWNEVQDSFPELIYLEKFRCPKLTFFPCNESGVWLKPGN